MTAREEAVEIARKMMALAEKATPGPWDSSEFVTDTTGAAVWGPDGDAVAMVHGNLGWIPEPIEDANNAAYIAFANPENMRKLCEAVLEQAESGWVSVEGVLLPCPFCGTTPAEREHRSADETGERYGYSAVECPKCYGGQNGRFCGVHAHSPKEARLAWNERRTFPSTFGENDAIK